MARFLLPVALILMAGCASAPKRAATGIRVAVLPAANESVDVEAPAKVRGVLLKLLAERGYQVENPAAVDATLREQHGVTDGGQLRVVSPAKLRENIPGEYWVFPTIEEYGYKSAAALSQRKVVIALRVVEAATGKTIFQERETGVTTKAGVDAAGDLAINMAGKVLKSLNPKKTDVADTELTEETRQAINKLLDKLPAR